MAIRRLPRPPHAIPLNMKSQTLYEVELTATPSRIWRAAFLRPPAALMTTRFTPELGRVGLDGTRLIFRATPSQLIPWLRRIDRWIAYANSVVEE